MVCVLKDRRIDEDFHRQNIFFLHFAYRGSYDAISAKYGNRITIEEGDCYIGQPYSGYAAKKESEDGGIIIGVLIRTETFIKEYLPSFSADTAMLEFFLEPHKNRFADEFIHMKIPASSAIWRLLGLLVLEYANKTEDSQKIMKPMVTSLCMYLSAEYRRVHHNKKPSPTDRMIEYIDAHADEATLSSVASHFGYHPVYLSRLLPEKTGKTFSQILTESRMMRAEMFLRHTDLPIEKIAAMLGYSNSSNFYKAFRQYFGSSPRELK